MHSIKYYPVGNGDHSMIKTNVGTTIVVDCNIRQISIDSEDNEIYDVKKDMLDSISYRNGYPFIDAFILTHGDNDHCRGYKENFYQGDPKSYSKKDMEAGLIMIDEMWFSPMIAEECTNDDEDAYQMEAERRLELHKKNHIERNLPGNRVKIVGYDGKKQYKDLEHLRLIPGTVVSTINNIKHDTFSIFVHAPFKEHLSSLEKDKNATSIVFQARFKSSSNDSDFSGLAIFGGDSDYNSWHIILEKTIKYKNDLNEKALNWDIFLSPHHCSWSFFNDRPQEENPVPKDSSLKILDYKRKGGYIIASSKKIVNDDDNPPHYKAKLEYIKKVDSIDYFLNTGVFPKESKPEPIIFEITSLGVKKAKTKSEQEQEKLDAAKRVASAAIIQKPWCKNV